MSKLPRMEILVSDTMGSVSQGELKSISLGFALFQAWMFATVFGSACIFTLPMPELPGFHSAPASLIAPLSVVDIIAFALALIIMGLCDRRIAPLFFSKKTPYFASGVCSLGTLLVVLFGYFDFTLPVTSIITGIILGFSAAFLLIMWGKAFARCGSASIVLNALVAVALAVCIYVALLHMIPYPFSAIITAALPLLQIPLLLRSFTQSNADGDDISALSPLPVRVLPFAARLGLPMLITGLALGSMRSFTAQVILSTEDLSLYALVIVGSCMLTLVILVFVLMAGIHQYWDSLLRFFLPFTMITLLFLPLDLTSDSVTASIALTTGYICLEALMWVYLSQLSQVFRLSPILIFGTGRGCLALGSLVGTFTMSSIDKLDALTPFGDMGSVVVYIAALILAYALLPRVRDVKIMIDPERRGRVALHRIGLEAEELRRVVESSATIKEVSEEPQDNKDAENSASEASGTATPQTASPAALQPLEAATEPSPALENAPQTSPLSHDQEQTHTPTQGSTLARTTAQPQAPRPSVAAGQAKPSPASKPAAERTPTAPKASMSASGGDKATSNTTAKPVRETKKQEAESASANDSFLSACEEIANEYMLSRRQTEVMLLLARGRNASYIQEKLSITQNTAKSHIYHIYQKLGIHTQQELLDMVGEAEDRLIS